jgi:hypothetical protein
MSMARIICSNGDGTIKEIQPKAFRTPDEYVFKLDYYAIKNLFFKIFLYITSTFIGNSVWIGYTFSDYSTNVFRATTSLELTSPKCYPSKFILKFDLYCVRVFKFQVFKILQNITLKNYPKFQWGVVTLFLNVTKRKMLPAFHKILKMLWSLKIEIKIKLWCNWNPYVINR